MLKFLQTILQFLFTGIALCLALAFVLRIFAPGNADTSIVFQSVHPVQPWLDKVCNFLTLPIDKTLTLITIWWPAFVHGLPPALKEWFPIVPAEKVARQMAHWILLIPQDQHSRYVQDLKSAPY